VERDLGQILHVDLTTERIWSEPLPQSLVLKYLGARGINAKILWDGIKSNIDPLGPDNLLIFGVGVLTGTHAPCSGRMTITCKGPATGLYLKTNVGGHFGAALRFAGYCHLVIHGTSRRPVYLRIDGPSVELVSAGHLWGLDVRQTTKRLREEAGGKEVQVACIGQAGENLVKMAAIMCSTYNAAARGGVGAVMGSKRLKAVVVSGQRPIRVADPKRFALLVKQAREKIREAPSAHQKYLYGTSGSLAAISELRALPSYNFQRGYFEQAYEISGQNLVEAGYLKGRAACFACPVGCHRYTEVNAGKYAGAYTGGPEYETLASLGAGCGVGDVEAIIKANELCNIYGLDTISTGSAIQWLIECKQRGVLSEDQTDGLQLEWGNGDTVVELVKRIVFREGIGDLLAEGVKRAAEAIGKDSYKWAIQVKGLEQSRVETRSAKGYALAFAVNPRGPDHLHAQPIAEFGFRPAGVKLIEKITGSAEYANPYISEKRAEIVIWHEDCYAAGESLGFCSFPLTADFAITPEMLASFFSAAMGVEITEEELMQAGRRILTLEKCFNVREGATRADDHLPWRLMHEEAPDRAGAINSPEEVNKMLDEYYSLHGWDVRTSWPTKETLESLDMAEVAEELERMGRLP